MTDLIAGLTGTESAILLVLAAQAEPVRNPDLKTLGPELKADSRRKLQGRGLIEVTVGPRRSNVIELSDRGWAAAAALLEAQPPAATTPATRALFTLARGLGRYLRRESLGLGEVFTPGGAPVTVVAPTATEPTEPAPTPPPGMNAADSDVATRIWDAYHRLAPAFGAWVALRRLRDALPDVPRRAVDDALTELYVMPGVDIAPEMNQKALTAEDRRAALTLGGRQLFAMRVMA